MRPMKSKTAKAAPIARAPAEEPKKTEGVSQERIAMRAYEIWQQSGCPEGHDQEFWFKAEAELRAG